MNKELTKKDLTEALSQFGKQIDKRFSAADKQFDAVGRTIRVGTQDIVDHFNRSQAAQNKRLEELSDDLRSANDRLVVVETKVDTVLDELATRKELRNLVGELKKHGVPIQADKVFVS